MAVWCKMTRAVITERRRSMYRSRWAISHHTLGRENCFAAHEDPADSVLHDGCERVRLEASSTYQCSVDLFLANERCGVVWLHAAAVENPDVRRHFSTQQLCHFRADDLVRLHCDFGRRGFARTDGPHRLVSDHDRRGSFRRNSGKGTSDLSLEHIGCLVGLALRKHFTHADDWNHSMLECRMQLLVHDLVSFRKVLAPLGMPDQGLRTADK